MASLGPTASDTYSFFPDFTYKYCHHTWCKFCFLFLFTTPVGLPFSVGMLQLLLCNELPQNGLARRPSFCVARTGRPERVVQETDGRHGAGKGAASPWPGWSPPLLAGGARTPCSDSVQLAVPDQLSRVLTGGPGCEHEHSPYLMLSHVW